jgi:RND superfamily putative drug exporter
MMDTVYAALGRFDVRFRYVIVAAWIIVTILCIRAFPSLDSVIPNASFSSFLPSSSPSIQATNLESPFRNFQFAAATIVASRQSGSLTPQDEAAISRLATVVRLMPHVKTVRDLSTSPDGDAMEISIQADVPTGGTGTGVTLVNNVRQAFGQVSAPADLTFNLTGQLAINVDTQASDKTTRNAIQMFTYLLIIVLLLLAFRAVLAPLLTLIPAALVLLLSSPVIAGGVTRFGVPASSLTQEILIVIILGAGTDYGLFLTFRVREELRRGLAPNEAVVKAVQSVGETITFSALTVIVALTTLIVAQFGVYQSFGPAIAIGIALLLLAGLTLLPALLAIFGRAVFWPTSTRRTEQDTAGLWSQLTRRLIQRPALTLTLGVILFVGLALGQMGTSLGGFGGFTGGGGPSGADSTQGTAVINAHYPNANQNPAAVVFRYSTPIWSQLGNVAIAQQGLGNIHAFKAVLGPLDPNGIPLTVTELTRLHALLGSPQALPVVPPASSPVPLRVYDAYRSIGQYVSADGKTVLFLAPLQDNSSSPAAFNTIPQLRTEVASVATHAGASKNGIASSNAFAYDITQISNSDLERIIPIVGLMIAILLALVLRSLIAPLYLVASVALSFLAAWGLVAIIFVHLGVSNGVQFVLPFILFVFLMALGSDYNILVMRRIREEAFNRPLPEAVREAISRTGGTVTAAGMILAGTFAVLGLTGNSDQIRQIGFGVAAGILMDTFLIRTLLIPALVVLLGRWNWWPSRLFYQKQPEAAADDVVEEAVAESRP